MRLLHTSDWHVGRKIRGRSRVGEQKAVLAEIAAIAGTESVDISVVSGDLFDVSSPSSDDERLVYRALLDLAEVAPVAIVAGNHDGPSRLEAVRPLLELGRIVVVAAPRRPEDGGVVIFEGIGLKLALLPFVSHRSMVKVGEIMNLDPDQHHQSYEARMRRVIESLTATMGTDTVNVLASHLTAFGGVVGGGERDSHIFGYAVPPQVFPGSLTYVALGHLHRQQSIAAPTQVWYSGSPLQLDFGEKDDSKGVLLVDADPGKPASVRQVGLESGVPLIQLEGTLDEVLARAGEVEGAYVKVLLDEPGRAGLNDEVREAIPGAVDVVVRSVAEQRPRRSVDTSAHSPTELFREYLKTRELDDPDVVDLFREIEQDVSVQ
ncbi:MAG: exonuclease SbcCD subunit D [Actinobacteria bacterium]|nr:exonuclease SbcCD subunit D [Actinomycetota bacterium]